VAALVHLLFNAVQRVSDGGVWHCSGDRVHILILSVDRSKSYRSHESCQQMPTHKGSILQNGIDSFSG
jgi:hypothetical protein